MSDWVKFYIDTVDSDAMQTALSRSPYALQALVWVFCQAGKHQCPEFELNRMHMIGAAAKFRIGLEDLQAGLNALDFGEEGGGLCRIEQSRIQILDWEQYQSEYMSRKQRRQSGHRPDNSLFQSGHSSDASLSLSLSSSLSLGEKEKKSAERKREGGAVAACEASAAPEFLPPVVAQDACPDSALTESQAPGTSPYPQAAAPESTNGDFEEFWQQYPLKRGKKAAARAWKRLHPTQALRERILAAIQEQRASPQWLRENGRFIPHPATWLNEGRWDDETAPLDLVPKRRSILGEGSLEFTPYQPKPIGGNET